jgi:hypothetical protein
MLLTHVDLIEKLLRYVELEEAGGRSDFCARSN